MLLPDLWPGSLPTQIYIRQRQYELTTESDSRLVRRVFLGMPMYRSCQSTPSLPPAPPAGS